MTPPLEALGMPAWIVGGAVRDRLLGRSTEDVDVVVAGDPRAAARRLKEATGAAIFALSEAFGAWRAVGPERAWQVDLTPLPEGGLVADLAARDFTVNAMAEPVGGGDVVDPHGGRGDLAARRLRMVSASAFDDDPLRTVRAARLAAELGFEVDAGTAEAARSRAPRLDRVAAERIWAELRRIVGSSDPVGALGLTERLGVTAAVLPELLVLRGVEQNVFHHCDVHDHTLEVLAAVVALERDPSPLGPAAAEAARRLAEPLGDDLTRWGSLRWAALLHDIAKPQTRRERPDGRGASFVGHDAQGAVLARAILRRLRASERVVGHVAALARDHLRAGFLVHERPLGRRSMHRYLKATDPWSVDVTVLTVADRLATRGRNAEEAIPAHLEVAAELLAAAVEGCRTEPLLRGDELARELGIPPGPRLGALLDRLEEDRFAGDIATREEAVRRARELLDTLPAP